MKPLFALSGNKMRPRRGEATEGSKGQSDPVSGYPLDAGPTSVVRINTCRYATFFGKYAFNSFAK